MNEPEVHASQELNGSITPPNKGTDLRFQDTSVRCPVLSIAGLEPVFPRVEVDDFLGKIHKKIPPLLPG